MRIRPLLLGFTVPDETAAELFAIDPLPQVQTHRFAWSLARSLKAAFGEVRLLSACPVQAYPLVPKLLFRSFGFTQDGIAGVTVGFVNLPLLKHLTRLAGVVMRMPRILGQANTVFIHGVHTPWLVAGRLLQMCGMQLIPVLTDPPGVILTTDGPASRLLKLLDQRLVGYLLSRATVVVSLSPDLGSADQGRRTLVFPGIVNRDWVNQVRQAGGSPAADYPPTVLYAGGVSAAYGVDKLLEAARLLPHVQFVVLGRGDQVARIQAERLSNLRYLGFVDPSRLAPHLLAADILINPRPSRAEFALRSFPSKLLEYVASGRTVLTTRIRSIPPAIADCFDYIDDESPAGIAEAIRIVLARPRTDRLAEARVRAESVASEFSEEAVGQKLQTLVSMSC